MGYLEPLWFVLDSLRGTTLVFKVFLPPPLLCSPSSLTKHSKQSQCWGRYIGWLAPLSFGAYIPQTLSPDFMILFLVIIIDSCLSVYQLRGTYKITSNSRIESYWGRNIQMIALHNKEDALGMQPFARLSCVFMKEARGWILPSVLSPPGTERTFVFLSLTCRMLNYRGKIPCSTWFIHALCNDNMELPGEISKLRAGTSEQFLNGQRQQCNSLME